MVQRPWHLRHWSIRYKSLQWEDRCRGRRRRCIYRHACIHTYIRSCMHAYIQRSNVIQTCTHKLTAYLTLSLSLSHSGTTVEMFTWQDRSEDCSQYMRTCIQASWLPMLVQDEREQWECLKSRQPSTKTPRHYKHLHLCNRAVPFNKQTKRLLE